MGEKGNDWLISSQVLNPEANTRNRSVILIHGFVGSPFDFKPLAEPLCNKGFRVVIPVVPEQTKATPAFKRGKYTPEKYIKWLSEIVDDETKLFNKKPFLAGFSMGGALSTVVAARGTVDKLVLLAPFYSLPNANDLLWAVSRVLRWGIPVVPKFTRGKINDPEGYKRYAPGSYAISLNAFRELQELAVVAKESIEMISIPVLILGSPHDEVASFSVTKELFGSKSNTSIREFPESNHILLYDFDHRQIIQNILEFLINDESVLQ
ncbi:alpha/beta hydrolase [Thermodesulfobacteriota bacterium]